MVSAVSRTVVVRGAMPLSGRRAYPLKTTALVLQMMVRIVGAILIVLGVLFWTGNADALIPVHMLLGIALVLMLWTLAVLAALGGVHWGLVVLALVWGLIVPALGLTQTRLLPGSAHWVIQVIHLLVGLGAIGQADNLARRIRSRGSTGMSTRRAKALEGAAR